MEYNETIKDRILASIQYQMDYLNRRGLATDLDYDEFIEDFSKHHKIGKAEVNNILAELQNDNKIKIKNKDKKKEEMVITM